MIVLAFPKEPRLVEHSLEWVSQKLRPLDCLKKKDLHFFEKDLHCKLVSVLITNVLWSRNVHRQPPERSDIFIFSSLLLWRRSNSEKLTRFKIAADTLMTFAGEFFTEVAINNVVHCIHRTRQR